MEEWDDLIIVSLFLFIHLAILPQSNLEGSSFMTLANLNASQMLDKACQMENDGKPALAERALGIAINRDIAEHAANPETASLKRS